MSNKCIKRTLEFNCELLIFHLQFWKYIIYIALQILADWEIEKSEWQANVGYQTERIFGLIDS